MTRGFSYLELLIYILLFGILGTMLVPNIFERKGSVFKKFAGDIHTLVLYGVQQAMITKKVHQIYFDMDNSQGLVKQHDPALHEKPLEEQFIIPDAYKKQGRITIPEGVQFSHFVIEGVDEVKSQARLNEVWFYCMPSGIVQDTKMDMIFVQDDETTTTARIIINPFFGRLSYQEGV